MEKSTHAPDGYIWSQTMFAFGCQRKDIVTKSFIGAKWSQLLAAHTIALSWPGYKWMPISPQLELRTLTSLNPLQ